MICSIDIFFGPLPAMLCLRTMLTIGACSPTLSHAILEEDDEDENEDSEDGVMMKISPRSSAEEGPTKRRGRRS